MCLPRSQGVYMVDSGFHSTGSYRSWITIDMQYDMFILHSILYTIYNIYVFIMHH